MHGLKNTTGHTHSSDPHEARPMSRRSHRPQLALPGRSLLLVPGVRRNRSVQARHRARHSLAHCHDAAAPHHARCETGQLPCAGEEPLPLQRLMSTPATCPCGCGLTVAECCATENPINRLLAECMRVWQCSEDAILKPQQGRRVHPARDMADCRQKRLYTALLPLFSNHQP